MRVTPLRLSLRELLLLVAITALAIASVRYASSSWRTATYSITMIVFMAAAVVAAVDRGPRQAFAIGMVLTMIIYALLVRNGVYGGRDINRELDPSEGRLPTTRISRFFYVPVVTVRWFNNVGNPLPNFDPNNPPPGVTGWYSQTSSTPNTQLFMQIVHCWWALLLGYIGGLFARFVYSRRQNDVAAFIRE